jgi:hypothetical protein
VHVWRNPLRSHFAIGQGTKTVPREEEEKEKEKKKMMKRKNQVDINHNQVGTRQRAGREHTKGLEVVETQGTLE